MEEGERMKGRGENGKKDGDRLASLETVKPLVNCLKALRSWTECVESLDSHPPSPAPHPHGRFRRTKAIRPVDKTVFKIPASPRANCF